MPSLHVRHFCRKYHEKVVTEQGGEGSKAEKNYMYVMNQHRESLVDASEKKISFLKIH